MQANSQLLPYAVVQDRRSSSERASLSSVLVLAITLNASLFAKFFEGSMGNILQGGAMALLVGFSLFCKRQFSMLAIPKAFQASIIGILLVTLILGLMGGFAGFTEAYLKTSVLFKSMGIILTLTALWYSAPIFNQQELEKGLILFAVVEASVCLFLFYIGTEINANALAVRLSVAAMVVLSLTEKPAFRIAGIAGCVGFSLLLQCRTSLCAFLGALVFMYVERNTRKNRPLVLFSVVIGSVLAWVMLPSAIELIKNIAISSLGSDNFIAKFFLEDKSADKLQYDMLDRNAVWEYSWEYVSQRLWTGYGLGTENTIMGFRSHNAYLSLMFEGGIFNLLAWVWFYYLSLVRLFDKRLLKQAGSLPLFYLSNLLIGYMLLASMVETSGMASVSTPINLIFFLLVIWLFSPRNGSLPRSRPNARRFA